MLEGLIDKQYRRKVLEITSPERIRLAREEVLTDMADNPLVDLFDDWIKDNGQRFDELLSRTAQKLLLGDEKKMMTVNLGEPGGTWEEDQNDTPRPASRRIVRMRLINHVVRENKIPRRKAREVVAKLTDDQIDAAVGSLPVQGVGDWFKAIFDYIKNNWVDILKMLLPLLLIFLATPDDES